MKSAIDLSWRAREYGNHPFGAVLVDSAGHLVAEAVNTVNSDSNAIAHAELNLISEASRTYGFDDMLSFTIYASTEPCPMCAAAAQLAGLGYIVFGMSRERLLEVVRGPGGKPSMRLGCRDLLSYSQREVQVIGPILETEAKKAHLGFWPDRTG